MVVEADGHTYAHLPGVVGKALQATLRIYGRLLPNRETRLLFNTDTNTQKKAEPLAWGCWWLVERLTQAERLTQCDPRQTTEPAPSLPGVKEASKPLLRCDGPTGRKGGWYDFRYGEKEFRLGRTLAATFAESLDRHLRRLSPLRESVQFRRLVAALKKKGLPVLIQRRRNMEVEVFIKPDQIDIRSFARHFPNLVYPENNQ